MTNSAQPATQRIKREAKIGFAVFLLLFGAFSYIILDRVVSGFNFDGNDFDSVPLAQMIPPEDLPNIRNPDYVLPTMQSRAVARKDSAPSPAISLAPSNTRAKNPNEANSAESITSEMTEAKNSAIALSSHQEEIKKDDNLELNVETPARKIPAAKTLKSEPLINPLSTPPQAESPNDFQPPIVRGPKVDNSFETPTPLNKSTHAAEPKAADQDGTLPFQSAFPRFQQGLPEPLNPPLPNPVVPNPIAPNPTAQKTVIKETQAVSQSLSNADAEVITVSEQDTLWELATKIYGDGRLFAAVHEANKDKLTGQAKLATGLKLRFPAKAQLLREFRAFIPQDILDASATPSNSDSSNRREYTTRNGDTLFSIAREELGQASRYVEILELNSTQLSKSIRHGDELAAGLMLELPAK
jgi:LysM repeat protein